MSLPFVMHVAAIVLVHIVTTFPCSTSSNFKTSLDITYPAPSGVKCIKCSPGTYLLRHCTENNTNAKCKLCDNGTYTSDYNTAEYCAKCTPHCENLQLVPVQHCTHTSNLTCGCPDGTYNLYPHKPLSHAVCQEDGICPPGYGSQTTGASTKNISCVRCILGQTYSSTTSSVDMCQPCTQCEQSDVQVECSLTHDRKCNNVHSGNINPLSSIDVGVLESITPTTVFVFIGACVVIYFLRKSKKLCFKEDRVALEESRSSVADSSQNRSASQQYQNCAFLPIALSAPPVSHTSPRSLKLPGQTNKNILGILKRIVDGLLHNGSWEFFIRDLYLAVPNNNTKADLMIKEARANYPQNVREQIYQCLQHIWDNGATSAIFTQVLSQPEYCFLRTEFQNEFPAFFNVGPIESTV